MRPVSHSGKEYTEIGRVRAACLDVRDGLHYRFPPCCVLRFALRRLVWPAAPQAIERGVRGRWTGNPYVPCGFFHHGASWRQVEAEDSES